MFAQLSSPLAFSYAACLLLVALHRPALHAEPYSAQATRAMVATVHPQATAAGLTVLQRGGNAIDAAVAAGLMLGVVDGHNSGIGGGCFLLIRTADGKTVAIDGRETAPSAATPEMYFRKGKADTSLSQTGPLASGVPGALAAYALAVEQYGRRPLAESLELGAAVADEGFAIDRNYAARLRGARAQLASFPGSRAIFLKADGSAYEEGEVLRQPDLAKTYRAIAQHGIDWFYRGPFAATTAKWMRDNGGIMTADDFAQYRPLLRQPIISKYRGHEIVGFPPPSSGGVHIAQMLQMLEGFDLAEVHRQDPAQWVHLVTEAMKLAFADRAHWLGDPAFAKVPRGLIDPAYAAGLAQRIDPRRATPVTKAGTPPAASPQFFDRHTTHIAVADAEGNWVALTQTVNTGFGSKVVVPGLGVILNNEMDDFAVAVGVPNAFGLLGSEANQVQAGKRPLSSMTPTIVLRDGRPWLTVGAAGGPRIITQVLLMLLRRIDLEMPIEAAIAAPRFHHQWQPDKLLLTSDWPPDVVEALRGRGHDIELTESLAVVQAIELRADGTLVGVHDPRIPGAAAGH